MKLHPFAKSSHPSFAGTNDRSHLCPLLSGACLYRFAGFCQEADGGSRLSVQDRFTSQSRHRHVFLYRTTSPPPAKPQLPIYLWESGQSSPTLPPVSNSRTAHKTLPLRKATNADSSPTIASPPLHCFPLSTCHGLYPHPEVQYLLCE